MKTNKHFKTRLSVLLLLVGAINLPVMAQFNCDSILVDKVQHFPFDSNQVEVSAMSITFDCVSYPSFILLDQNGDTLAIETVNYFCLGLGSLQSHALEVFPDAVIPDGPFMGTLQLFAGFNETLICSWDRIFNLCPQDSCVSAEVYLTNTDTLQEGNVYWYLNSTDGITQASGVFEMDLADPTQRDSVCVPPGTYELWVSPFSDIWVDEDFLLGINASQSYGSGINTVTEGSSDPMYLSIDLFEKCHDFSNGVEEASRVTFTWQLNGGTMLLNSIDTDPLGHVELLDLHGRTLRRKADVGHSTSFSITGLSAGIYIVLNQDQSGHQTVQRLYIP